MAKQRIDTLLAQRGLAESREKAKALVMAGQVLVDGHPAVKPGTLVPADAVITVREQPRYVSRGGEKLEAALHAFGMDVKGLIAADIGSSTGGFTDCLLQHGAARVYAVDVGKGQLDYRLRKDRRVVVMEGVNVRHLDSLPQPVDLVTVDVSFISLRLVLPAVAQLFDRRRRGIITLRHKLPVPAHRLDGRLYRPWVVGSIVALFKPQFEAEKGEVPRGGVIRDPQQQAALIGRFVGWCTANGFRVLDMVSSPILGASGNREFLFWLRHRLSNNEERPL